MAYGAWQPCTKHPFKSAKLLTAGRHVYGVAGYRMGGLTADPPHPTALHPVFPPAPQWLRGSPGPVAGAAVGRAEGRAAAASGVDRGGLVDVWGVRDEPAALPIVACGVHSVLNWHNALACTILSRPTVHP